MTLLVLTIASGLIQGRMTNRWGVPEDVLALGRRLEELPASFGDWQLVRASELGEDATKMLQPYGYFGGTFRHRISGHVVTMFVILGPAEHLCGHTPEACFYSRDYEQIGDREIFTLKPSEASEETDTFWRVPFRRQNVNQLFVPAYYSWSNGNRWIAGDDPRFLFAHTSYVFKLQLFSALPNSLTTQETDPCQEFLADFLPVAAPYFGQG